MNYHFLTITAKKRIDLEIQNIREVERFSSVALILNYSKEKSFMLMWPNSENNDGKFDWIGKQVITKIDYVK